ncbi:hypothetical protein M758_7G120600 [Ceratodon purpureus]|nr:hypothetical protein M758_7G120600 [Ceratodon purpureus]
MAEDGMKREGTELFGLPPRKRFKVMEQQRKKEIQEETPVVVDSHCNDITNVMPLHRVSPKKLTSQGFLVLEKQKYKLQQQKLQENLVPAMPPLPPRPVAVKRKEAPALLLPAPPTSRLKFQGEKVHSPSSSAFKSWGGPSPNKIVKSESAPVVPKSSESPREALKDQEHKPKRHQQESLSATAHVEQAKTWTMAKGTTCSINKAQEDVEMLVCETPALSSDMCSSDEDVVISTSTTSSVPMEALDLNVAAEGDNEFQIASDDNMVEAPQIPETVTMPAIVPSVVIEDVSHEGQDLEDVASDLVCPMPSEDIHIADVSPVPFGNTATVDETAHVDIAQSNEHEEIVEIAQQLDGSSLDTHVEQTDFSGAQESRVVEASETLIDILEVAEEPKLDTQEAPIVEEPEACSPRLASPLAIDSSTVALAECHIDSETLNTLKASDDSAVAVRNEDETLSGPCDKADDETCSERKGEEEVALPVIDEAEVHDAEETLVVTTPRDSLEVTEGRNEQVTDMEQDGLLAEIDERAEKLFKRMFEKERDTGCDDEEDGSEAQFFFASNGVNNFNSLVVGMEVDGEPTSNFQNLDEASTPEQKNGDGRVVDASSLKKDHQIALERPTVHVPNKPPEEMACEMPESSSRDSEGNEDSVCSEDQESDSPIAAHASMRSHQTVCKSSKEDSDWDLEAEVPNFGLGKRSGGMTQRVKAPGRWSQSSEGKAMNLDEEADEEADEDEEEGACDVCRSADAKPSDPIVYCDGCDIPVHADCYGKPLSHGIPEGDWFCAQCQSKRPDSRNCCLCPRSGGVMKKTTDGNWAHLSCAVFVPEVFFRKANDMEGIDTSHVPSKRYLAKCCVCKSLGGACVDCTEIGCKSKFHVSCALKKDLAMEFRNGRSGAIVISFCQEHTAAWDEQQERKGRSKYKIVSREPQKPKVFQRSKSR